MSLGLVDYGSSGESDVEDDTTAQPAVQVAAQPKSTTATSGLTASLPAPSASSTSKVSASVPGAAGIKPKEKMSLAEKRKMLFSMPKVDDADSDSDDEGSRPKVTAIKGAGLTSLLPAPKTGKRVQVDSGAINAASIPASSDEQPSKKVKPDGAAAASEDDHSTLTSASSTAAATAASATKSKSMLVPDVLRFKHRAAASRPKAPKPKSAADSKADAARQQQEDQAGTAASSTPSTSSQFFSLPEQDGTQAAATATQYGAGASIQEAPPSYDESQQYEPVYGYGKSSFSATGYTEQSSALATGSSSAAQPRRFGYGHSGPASYTYQEQMQVAYQSGAADPSGHGMPSVAAGVPEHILHNVPDRARQEMERLAKREGRGKKAVEVNFVEVHDSERRDTFDEWQRKYGDQQQPTTDRSVVVPTGTAKRKHQITYLAAEAKARENELKAFWSEGAAKRKAAKFRYGF